MSQSDTQDQVRFHEHIVSGLSFGLLKALHLGGSWLTVADEALSVQNFYHTNPLVIWTYELPVWFQYDMETWLAWLNGGR